MSVTEYIVHACGNCPLWRMSVERCGHPGWDGGGCPPDTHRMEKPHDCPLRCGPFLIRLEDDEQC